MLLSYPYACVTYLWLRKNNVGLLSVMLRQREVEQASNHIVHLCYLLLLRYVVTTIFVFLCIPNRRTGRWWSDGSSIVVDVLLYCSLRVSELGSYICSISRITLWTALYFLNFQMICYDYRQHEDYFPRGTICLSTWIMFMESIFAH